MPFKQPYGTGGNSDAECYGVNKKKGIQKAVGFEHKFRPDCFHKILLAVVNQHLDIFA
jgi:hypothetical protein